LALLAIRKQELQMNKGKKIFIASVSVILGGLGVFKYLQTRKNGQSQPAETWTRANMPDLAGKIVIVTGANSGIGFEAAKAFAQKGAQTILACRSTEKAQAALDQIQAEIPGAKAEIMQLDLASLNSIGKFAAQFKARHDRLDLLLNNAGIMMTPYGLTEDGFERQFGTNHLGHFTLTGLLIDLLLNTPGSRIVNVSSNGHRMGDMDFDNLMFENGKGYSPVRAYGRSKLANLLFTYELQRRMEAIGANTIATAAHPGLSNTDLADHIPAARVFRPLMGFTLQSAAMGALPSLRAAVDPSARGGEYFGPSGKGQRRGHPVLVESNEASHNEVEAKRLWEISETLAGITYL
jgi:NAD(P)-dependent dehydrogenase (short-subunit alcohol dehydrogenase family)